MSDKYYAVVLGEISDARKISRDHLGELPNIIRAAIKEVNEHVSSEAKLVYEVIRMDEFLCLSENPHTSLNTLLMLASEFRSRSHKILDIRADLRLSIGIGPVELFQRELRESDGTAFRLSDKGFHKMRRNQRLSIISTNEELNEEFDLSCTFMDILIHDWSDEQAEALFLRLSGKNQMEISEILKISQPAVNRRLKAAHYDAIEKFIKRFESLVTND